MQTVSIFDSFKALKEFPNNPIHALKTLNQRYGDMVYLSSPANTLILYHPDYIQELLLKNSKNTTKGKQTKLFKYLVGQSLIVDEKSQWRKKRLMIQKYFNAEYLKSYQTIINDVIDSHIHQWPKQQSFDLKEAITALVFDISCRIFLGSQINQDGNKLRKSVETVGKVLFSKFSLPFNMPFWIPSPKHRKFHAGIRYINQTIYPIIEQQRKQPTEHDHLLKHLINDESSLTDSQIRNEILCFMVAGYETTSTMLCWTLYLLGKKPEYQNSKSYKNILKESLRMYPPSPLGSRKANQDMQISGHDIKEGTNIVFSQFLTHNDPRFWDDVEQFKPERFEKDEHKAFFPFSLGPRRCVGEQLSSLIGESVLSTLLQKTELKINSKECEFEFGVILLMKTPLIGIINSA